MVKLISIMFISKNSRCKDDSKPPYAREIKRVQGMRFEGMRNTNNICHYFQGRMRREMKLISNGNPVIFAIRVLTTLYVLITFVKRKVYCKTLQSTKESQTDIIFFTHNLV